MSSPACCKGESTKCTKKDDGSCTLTKQCFIDTPDGRKACECRCTCNKKGSESCKECVCNCNCTYETAQKIETAEGTKYRCECTCEC